MRPQSSLPRQMNVKQSLFLPDSHLHKYSVSIRTFRGQVPCRKWAHCYLGDFVVNQLGCLQRTGSGLLTGSVGDVS